MSVLTQDPVKAIELADGEKRFYNEEGYLFIPGLLSTEEAARLRAEVMHIMDVIGMGTTKLAQSNEYLEGSALDSFVNSPNLREVVNQLLGGPSSLYLPFTAVKSTGGGRFHFHQDNQYTRLDGPSVNCWFALNDMAPENGCLQLVPRSHLKGTLGAKDNPDGDGHQMIDWEPADFLPVRMRAGDCIAFSRLTVHGSGPNNTDMERVGYALQWHRDDVNWKREDGTWLNLKENPRWGDIGPKKEISIPTGKRDGH